MTTPPQPLLQPDPAVLYDPQRLQRLHALDLCNGTTSPVFAGLTRLAAHLFKVPIVIISLVEDDCQRFASQIGLPERFRSMTPLSHSFCQYVVSRAAPLSVDDARLDPVLQHNHAIPDLGIIAYLGWPLTTRDGLTLGTLAVIDTQPRSWTDTERDLLADLAAAVMTEVELRDRLLHSRATEAHMHRAMDRMQILRRIDHELAEALDLDSVLTLVMDTALRASRADHAAIVLLRADALEVISGTGHYATGDRLELNRGILGRVIHTRTPELVSDVSIDPDYYAYVPTTRAQMTIPLQHRDHLIGLLVLETDYPARFTLEALEFLTLIGSRVAIAIDTAQMVQLLNQQYADLQRLYERVTELEQTKTDMIRIAAHDLRNPLGMVLGYAELLEEMSENLSEAQIDFLRSIQRGGQKMKKIITDILSLERFEANPSSLRREITDLGQLIKLTQADYATTVVEKRLAVDTDLPAHQGDDALADDQAKASAAVHPGGRGIGLRERGEQLRETFRRDADAGIDDLEAQRMRGAVLAVLLDAQGDATAFGELDGVAEQIGQHLSQSRRVTAHREADVGVDFQMQQQAFGLGLLGQQPDHRFGQLAQVEGRGFQFNLVGLELGVVEDVVDDAQHLLGRAVGGAQQVGLLGGQAGGEQHVDHRQDAVERRADLVAHRGEEFALRHHRGLGLLLGVFQFELEATMPLEFLVQRIDHALILAGQALMLGFQFVGLTQAAGNRPGSPRHQCRCRQQDRPGCTARQLDEDDRQQQATGRGQHQPAGE